MADTKVEIASYGAEQGGENIGWVSVVGKKEVGQFKVDTTQIHVGVAKISHEGARRGYTERVERGEVRKIVFPGDIEGFIASASLRMEVVKDMPLDEVVAHTPIDLGATSGVFATCSVVRAAVEDRLYEDRDTSLEVIENDDEFIEAIKNKLETHDARELYPIVYYGINTAIGHRAIREAMRGFTGEASPALVVDPAMQDTTAAQLDALGSIDKSLHSIIATDQRMKKDLTVFGEVKPEDVPHAFEVARGRVHKAEASNSEALSKLLLPRFGFLPVGSRRAWPYMDATLDLSDKRAFGVELDELESGDVEPVSRELEKEIQETIKRRAYTYAAISMLRNLLASEKAMERS